MSDPSAPDDPTLDEDRGAWDDGTTSLTSRAVRGAQLAGIGFVASQGLMFVAYLVLAHLISPADFGSYTAGTLITGFGGLFAEGGMMAALISRRDRMAEASSTAFFSLVVSGILLTAVGVAIAPLFGLFFRSDQVAKIEAVLSGWLFLKCITVVPDSLLQRRFSFARRMAVEPLGAVAFAATGIALGANGAGAWALVGAAYASMFVQVISAWLFARFRPRLRLASVSMWRELSSVARSVMLAELVRRVSSQVDGLVLGRLGGLAALGQYRNGLRIAQQPVTGFVNVVAYVLLPTLASISAAPERLATAVQRVYRIVIAAGMPISFAALPLGVPTAVILLGPTWRPAGHAIAALCGFVIGSAVIAIATEVFKVTETSPILVQVQLVGLVLIVITVSLGAALFGVVGVAAAMSISSCATALYALHRVSPLVGIRLRYFVLENVGPLIATALMLLVMVAYGAALDPLSGPRVVGILILGGEVLLGGLVYVVVLMAIDGSRRGDARALLLTLRRRRGGAGQSG